MAQEAKLYKATVKTNLVVDAEATEGGHTNVIADGMAAAGGKEVYLFRNKTCPDGWYVQYPLTPQEKLGMMMMNIAYKWHTSWLDDIVEITPSDLPESL